MNFPIQIKSDLYNSAKLVANQEERTISQQIHYWAYVGRTCIDNPDLPVSFVVDSLESLKSKEDETENFYRDVKRNKKS
jgi:hypothetical protein